MRSHASGSQRSSQGLKLHLQLHLISARSILNKDLNVPFSVNIWFQHLFLTIPLGIPIRVLPQGQLSFFFFCFFFASCLYLQWCVKQWIIENQQNISTQDKNKIFCKVWRWSRLYFLPPRSFETKKSLRGCRCVFASLRAYARARVKSSSSPSEQSRESRSKLCLASDAQFKHI